MPIGSLLVTEVTTISLCRRIAIPVLLQPCLEEILPLCGKLVVAIVTLKVLGEVWRRTGSLLVHLEELLLYVNSFSRELPLSCLEFILRNLQVVCGTEQMLQVHVGLRVNILEPVHLPGVIKYLVWISTELLLSRPWERLRSCLLLSKVSDLQLFLAFACGALQSALASAGSSLELVRLLGLSGHGRGHELVDLLVRLLDLSSEQILNLLLVAGESGGEGLCRLLA